MRQAAKTGSESKIGDLKPAKRRGRALLGAAGYLVPPALALVIAAIGWELWTRLAGVAVYIVPPPSLILKRLFLDFGFFAREGAMTLAEAMAGFALGSLVALSGAVLMAHSKFLEKSLLPLAILVKVTPMVAVAPLFVIWFGFGSMPKVLIAALMTFFPVLVNAITGFRSVNPGALDFLHSVKASKTEIFFVLRLPSSLPYLFTAFRTAIALSVIGAVVAEWFSGEAGLGAVIIRAHNNLDMPTLFAAILTLAFIGITLTILVSLIEKRLLFWHESTLAG